MLRVVLGIACALVLAVLGAHPVVRRVERRLGLTVLLSAGAPFLALGVAFRLPAVGVLTDDVVADLRPALEFGLGWLGFVVGMQFDVRELDALPERTGTVAFLESALPFALTAGACALALFGLESEWSLRDALVLGACAAPASPAAALVLAGRPSRPPRRLSHASVRSATSRGWRCSRSCAPSSARRTT
jgi:NhaP-type Na+/H+ or K+/H+ antiporter